MSVGESGQFVIFGEIANSCRLALALGDVAKYRAEMETVPGRPARETGLEREKLAILATAEDLDQLPARRLQLVARQVAHREGFIGWLIAGNADGVERGA